MSTSIVPEPFRRLGVRAGLNCSGTNTRYGGTRVWPEVREAMAAVTGVDVYLAELNEKYGGQKPEKRQGHIRREDNGAHSRCRHYL